MQFDVQNDEPFLIFQYLQEIAQKYHPSAEIIDLSRGDPGFCFTPSIRGREFASFVLWLDSKLNTSPEHKFLLHEEAELSQINTTIEHITNDSYERNTANRLLAYLRQFMDHAKSAAKDEGKNWTDFTVLQGLFNYCAMSGGSYLLPPGQELSRVIVAAWHRQELGLTCTSEDLIFTNGVSHAIGTLFKAFGNEGCGYLSDGDTVFIGSPVYAPYNSILLERGITPVTFAMDPVTGQIPESEYEKLRNTDNVKALILIDPNNPTGFSLPESDVQKLGEIAKEKDLLIITDEVYFSFFPKKLSIIRYCHERTIHLNARSKIERSTGLRFGEMLIMKEARDVIAKIVGMKDGDALWRLLIFSKAAGRTGGQFQHTTFVPGPAQLLGIAHLVLGGEERQAYIESLMSNRAIFYEELKLPHEGNLYYVLFDLNALEGCTTREMTIEEKLTKLAEKGVIYIPAYKFFAPDERDKPGRLTSVRASIVNTTPDRLRVAARRTRDVLC